MKIHLTWPIGGSKFFIESSKLLINSSYGLDAYFTIFVENKNRKFVDKKLENIAEIVSYTNKNGYRNAWDNMPKWDVVPKSKIVLGLDSDILFVNKDLLMNFVNKSLIKKSIIGTIAYEPAISNFEWKNLFLKYKLPEDDFCFEHGNGEKGPVYVNNGAILIPSLLLEEFKYCLRKWIKILSKTDYAENYFFTQIATTLALKDSQINFTPAPVNFNYLESNLHYKRNKTNIDNIALFHYNMSKSFFVDDFKKIKFEFSKKIIKKFYKSRSLL